MSTKRRVTVTVDEDVLAEGLRAVEDGAADSLSGWVNESLTAQAVRQRQLRALAEAVREYEAEAGEITEAEVRAQQRADRGAATVVRTAAHEQDSHEGAAQERNPRQAGSRTIKARSPRRSA